MPSLITHKKFPYLWLFKQKLQYTQLKVLGCVCFPRIPPSTSHKLAKKTSNFICIGYDSNHKGYRCYNPINNQIIISCHVVDEFFFPCNTILSSPMVAIPLTAFLPTLLMPSSYRYVPCQLAP